MATPTAEARAEQISRGSDHPSHHKDHVVGIFSRYEGISAQEEQKILTQLETVFTGGLWRTEEGKNPTRVDPESLHIIRYDGLEKGSVYIVTSHPEDLVAGRLHFEEGRFQVGITYLREEGNAVHIRECHIVFASSSEAVPGGALYGSALQVHRERPMNNAIGEFLAGVKEDGVIITNEPYYHGVQSLVVLLDTWGLSQKTGSPYGGYAELTGSGMPPRENHFNFSSRSTPLPDQDS